MKINLVLAAIVVFGSLACSSRDRSVVSESFAVKKDEKSYQKMIRQKTKKASIYVDFETRVKVGVVRLDAELQKRVKARSIRNYGVDKITPMLGEASDSGQEIFLLSVFHNKWDDDLLDSPNWHIVLEQSGARAMPKEVKRLNKKDFLRSFFSSVDNWSSEYLLRFDASASFASDTSNLSESGAFALRISHTDGEVVVGW